MNGLICIFASLFSFSLFAISEAGVTYDLSGGRFGDNLISYLHAKWVSYEKNIPLIYQPFELSSDLILDEKEESRCPTPYHLHHLNKGPVSSDIELPILYVCPYFPEDPWEQNHESWFHLKVDWKDSKFKKMAREMIAPKRALKLITPPADRISVALHIREGGGFDEKVDLLRGSPSNPMKFPPISFYAEGLKRILNETKGFSIYCYVFTDAKHPEKVIKKLKAHLPKKCNIAFDYRKKNNRHNANILEDFFSLFNFDILIRSQSNFSMAASLIGDFSMVYSPKDCIISENHVTITDVFFECHRSK